MPYWRSRLSECAFGGLCCIARGMYRLWHGVITGIRNDGLSASNGSPIISCNNIRDQEAWARRSPLVALTISWISRTPSERSSTSDIMGWSPFDSSFVFSLQMRVWWAYLTSRGGQSREHHLQNVRSWTSLEWASKCINQTAHWCRTLSASIFTYFQVDWDWGRVGE